MKLKILLFAFTLLFSMFTLAQTDQMQLDQSGSSCSFSNKENIAQHIIDWTLCGASFVNPHSTLFGAICLVLNGLMLVLSVIVICWNTVKYALFTMQHGAPGGDKIQGGLTVIRNALIITLLAPIVSNGFSPVQVGIKQFTEIGSSTGDLTVEYTSEFMRTKGSINFMEPINIELITRQVLISEMCAEALRIFHEQDKTNGAIPSSAEIVKINTRLSRSEGDLTISWDYLDPAKTTDSDDSENSACGSISMTIPDPLMNSGSGSGIGNLTWGIGGEARFEIGLDGSIKVNDVNPKVKPYADIVTQQHEALIKLIMRVRDLVKSNTGDLLLAQKLAAQRSQLNADSGLINSGYDQLGNAKNQAERNLIESAKKLIALNDQYKSDIISAGKTAALVVSEVDNVEVPCPSENDTLASTPCTQGESWQSQLQEQGWAALGTYYYVQMKINKKINELQQHLFNANLNSYFWSGVYDFEDESLSKIRNSQSSIEIYKRIGIIENYFNANNNSKNFSIDLSSVKNSGNTFSDTDTEGPFDMISAIFNDWMGTAASKITSAFYEGSTGSGDLVMRFVAVGIVLQNISTGLFVILAIIWLGSKFPAVKLASKAGGFASKVFGEGDSGGIGSIILWAAIIFMGLGVLFVYVIPAIPLIKWTLELMSWGIMMFMACVYAPIWMMSHAAITDERMVSENTISGWGMIFELLIRPVALVIAFYACIILMHVADIAMILITGFLIGMGSEGTMGIVGIVATVGITLWVGYQIMMRAFDLITFLPDALIERIGFGTRPLGDTKNDGSHHSIFGVIKIGNKMSAGNLAKSLLKKKGPADDIPNKT